MNLLDRALAYLAPAAALQRVAARDMLQQHEAMQRSYAAGQAGRLSAGWRPQGGSANGALERGRPLMTARGSELARNNPWIAHALRRLPAAIVGTGPTASAQGSKLIRQQVAEDWAAFADEGDLDGRASFAATLALAVRTVVEHGECFVVWQHLAPAAGRAVSLGWRLLPPYYLDAARATGVEAPGGTIREGIEYDADGKLAAYWFFDVDPLDTVAARLRSTSSRYPAEQVDHVFERLWIGQRRGVPWLAPAVITADDLQQYETAALWKARMAASLGLVINNTGPAPSALGAQSTDSTGRALEQLAPGAILRLRPGEEATQIAPPTDENFLPFWRSRLMAIAAGLGLPYASLTGDLSNANYSSLREGKLLFWELLDTWQWLMVHEQLLRPAWRRFGQARYAAGRTRGGVKPAVKWAFPKRPWVDPLKDGKALELELDLGLVSWPDAVGARGEDAEAQLVEVADWRPKLAAAGITLGRQAKAAAPAADPAEPTDPAAPADPVTE